MPDATADAAAPAGPPARRIALEGALVGLGAVVASVPVLRYWQQPLGVPFDYENDATFYLMVVRSMKEHGWYLTNPDLGFPSGQEMHDLALGGDNANFVVLRVLARFMEPGLALNVFFILTIALVAAAAHVVLRNLGVRRSVAAVSAVIYTFLPYHMIRRTPHVLLSSYAMVPIAVLVALAVMSADPPIVADRAGWWPGFRRGARTWWVLAACVGLASTGSYYAVFGAYLIVAGGAAAALARRSTRSLWSAGFAAAVIAAVTVVNTAPSILYWRRHGDNRLVAHRLVQETEIYGLRIQQLFMPRLQHRNTRLAELADRAWGGPVRSEPGQQLGVIAACGLAALLVIAGVAIVTRAEVAEGSRRQTLQHLGFLTVVSLLTATLSGLSYLLALLGLKQIRGWNRMSVVIGFLAIVAVAFGVEAVIEWVRRRRGAQVARVALAVGLVGLLGVAWYDQTAPVDTAVRGGVREAWESDATFFGEMADDLPTGAAVFEFPAMTFPEGGAIGRIGLYDGARGYLHAPSLRWGFGGMLGRVPTWSPELETEAPELTVATLRDAGFRAVFVDRFGYADNGEALIALLTTVVPPVRASPDGRYVWFDLEAASGG
ncbi:MAG: hypothetical protein AB7Q42_04850 [Acidimicrobiia bacterium]